eukprot:1693447-Amphidinium_carterae.1
MVPKTRIYPTPPQSQLPKIACSSVPLVPFFGTVFRILGVGGRSSVSNYHPTVFDYRPVENIFFEEFVLARFTGLGTWGIDPVMKRGGMVVLVPM